ncbi:VOC family protein [Paenibacillus motobuensis]|uniref:VOC family protein n=1 Tax=Paenibacillus TaxID=44249 RepID=UPI00203BE34C|nr:MULTISPECIES: VOC family protein [Paenibacillus]MCM3042407.1 VOC family protein [Paenibacillus lutimineralis]MCM3649511.1 VOC family protein [Paenibacillus motobuensis]
MSVTTGIHHITAIVGDVQESVDFYAGVLGLRLVKRTVNYEAPDLYHLYFGNENGDPGTIMSFYPLESDHQGILGGGQVGVIVLAVPPGSMFYWRQRLKDFGITYMDLVRFNEEYVRFADPSGLLIDLVESQEGPFSLWQFGGIPEGYAIKGLAGALLFSCNSAKTVEVLQEILGLDYIGEEEGLLRFKAADSLGNVIDLNSENLPRGCSGAGTVHHMAWRTKDKEEQMKYHELLEVSGMEPTPVVDRQYYKSLFFREPGGILFQVATDGPGFDNDEAPESLGNELMLPDMYEDKRERIAKRLKPFQVRVVKPSGK